MNRSALQWEVATLALPGQAESGDQHIVQPFPDGILVGAVDGLGHGAEAAAAAKLTLSILARHPHEPVPALLRRCHECLRETRGVAMSLASFGASNGIMTWAGVGNVEGILLRAAPSATWRHEALLLPGGVVGHHLPPLHTSALAVMRGDTLIFTTDGIRSGFSEGLMLSDPPQRLADAILAQHATGTDDALVLVARYVGSAA